MRKFSRDENDKSLFPQWHGNALKIPRYDDNV